MLAHFDPAVLRFGAMDSAEGSVIGEALTAALQQVEVSNELLGAPPLERVRRDLVEVELRAASVLNLQR